MSTLEDLSKYIPVGNVRQILPSSHFGKRLAKSTIWRWCMRGTRGRKLRTVRIGAGVYTTAEWISEFIEHLSSTPVASEQSGPLSGVPAARSTGRARPQSSQKLDQLGFK